MLIDVDASQMQGAISPLIYGAVVVWSDKYFDDKSKYWEDNIKKVNVAGVTNFRIGGAPAEYYHWKEPRGYYEFDEYVLPPVKGRPYDTIPELKEDLELICNVDSLMKFVQESNMSNLVINVNFVRGTAKEAAEWVRYCNIDKKYGIKYWEIGNELGYPGVVSWFHNNDARKYYFGGCEFQEREKLGVSKGLPSQTFSLKYPPVKDRLTVYVGSSVWQQVDNIRTAKKGDFFQYRESFTPGLYYKGEILFGDGINGNIPPGRAVISADYNSGPHDGLIDYMSQMKAVDPTIKVGPCGDEIDWYHEEVTKWTRTLLELDSTQKDSHKEFDFIAPHWHTIRLGDDACQALHRQDNFEHGLKNLKEAIAAAYKATKPDKVNLPIFIDEWKAVHWNPPMEQKLGSVLFTANGLGMLAKNKITQASITHLHAYLKTDGILAYENRDPAYKPNQEMPIFYVFQLVANKFGKVLIECLCGENSLRAYASVDRENPNKLCLLVINRDFTYNLRSLIKITGFTPQATADVWILNGDGMDLSTGININGMKLDEIDAIQVDKIAPRRVMNVSDSFSYTFPAHSVVVMQLSSK